MTLVGVAIVVTSPDFPGKILVVEEAKTDERTGKVAGMVSLPVGHIPQGELPAAGAIRELQEETGYTSVDLTGLVGYYSTHGLPGVAYKGILPAGILSHGAIDPEISRFFWVEPEKLLSDKRAVRPPTREIVMDYLSGKIVPLRES